MFNLKNSPSLCHRLSPLLGTDRKASGHTSLDLSPPLRWHGRHGRFAPLLNFQSIMATLSPSAVWESRRHALSGSLAVLSLPTKCLSAPDTIYAHFLPPAFPPLSLSLPRPLLCRLHYGLVSDICVLFRKGREERRNVDAEVTSFIRKHFPWECEDVKWGKYSRQPKSYSIVFCTHVFALWERLLLLDCLKEYMPHHSFIHSLAHSIISCLSRHFTCELLHHHCTTHLWADRLQMPTLSCVS